MIKYSYYNNFIKELNSIEPNVSKQTKQLISKKLIYTAIPNDKQILNNNLNSYTFKVYCLQYLDVNHLNLHYRCFQSKNIIKRKNSDLIVKDEDVSKVIASFITPTFTINNHLLHPRGSKQSSRTSGLKTDILLKVKHNIKSNDLFVQNFERWALSSNFVRRPLTHSYISFQRLLWYFSPIYTKTWQKSRAIKLLEFVSDKEILFFMPQLIQATKTDLASNEILEYLLVRSNNSVPLSSKLFWSLICEYDIVQNSITVSKPFIDITKPFGHNSLTNANKQFLKFLKLQKHFVTTLRSVSIKIKSLKDRAEQKTIRLQSLLNNIQFSDGFIGHNKKLTNFTSFEIPIPLPIEPYYILLGLNSESSYVFKSSQYPIVLSCRVLIFEDKKYRKIQQCSFHPYFWFLSESELLRLGYQHSIKNYLYKTGDDIRQDQFVTQVIKLVDRNLKLHGFHFALTTYNVLPLSQSDGFIEFINNSDSLSNIKREFKSIDNYLSSFKNHQLKKSKETFIRCCSVYSIITFLLGVGDRHLDNLLLTQNGSFFHVDFGFIFGQDPKPFPPPIKLCNEIIDAMSGTDSNKYKHFLFLSCLCFRLIRRQYCSLFNILSLLLLSNDLSIQSFEENYKNVITKFKLEIDEADADNYIINVIDISANAKFPSVIDKFHEWTVSWK